MLRRGVLIFLIFLFILICAPRSYSQGGFYRDISLQWNGVSLIPNAGAQVTVCTAAATGNPCSPTVTIYSNAALTITQTNPITTGSDGSWSLYLAPAIYSYTVTGTGLNPQGPFLFNVPLANGGSGLSIPSPTITNPTITGTVAGNPTITTPTLTSPTTTGTDSGTETLTSKTLTAPVINGTPTGTGIPTITLKKGTGLGNYTSASTTYVDVDAANLGYTVTIPTGWKLAIQASCSIASLTAPVAVAVALFDSATLVEAFTNGPAASNTESASLFWVINGDGASHTIKLQFHTGNGADSVSITNSTATAIPTMVFILAPSN